MSDQIYSLPLSESPEPQVSATSEVIRNEWLTPTTVAYHEQYMTPFPTTVLENQPWASFARPLMPTSTIAPPVLSTAFTPQFYMGNSMNRPRSSPSTFGPSPDNITWPLSAGLGIQYPPDLPAPPSAAQTDLFDQEPDHFATTPRTPTLQAPMPRRPYQAIAPNPAGASSYGAKRRRDDDEQDSDPGSGKRRRRTGSVASADLSEDDRYLVRLKEDESLPWKEIAIRFQTDKGKSFQVPALQMRYKRLREKIRTWQEQDGTALKLAHEYWNKYKWDIISQKMTEFGSPEKWPARTVARKWQEMEALTAVTMAATASAITPTMTTFTSSPADAPLHFAFLPIP